MENKPCKICDSYLEVQRKCKVCDEPTRLFCHDCGILAEKIIHPACLLKDISFMMVQTYSR